ncbi:amino acid ABC transporter substrate-binding protein [Azospirillum doebereinerae]|uniref:Amino acid ABC transporter substrate-binding protein n=1 Tax=Azospirillum doebereinerae TaxID=92933 RepID=A0A433J943_9PROT|nr:amino acid ABC transporter substrate-binding protein [Azospirillum doebereinerae]
MVAASILPRPAIAQSQPIRIGWLVALTGPISASAAGHHRGTILGAETINAAGGVKGRRIEIVTQDTQGDPSKAVGGAQRMIADKVDALWGPTSSGESLAITALVAKAKMPNIHPCVIDSLIEPLRYPNAFRSAPSNAQWDEAVRHYCRSVLKTKRVALFGDTSAYGVNAVNDSARSFVTDGMEIADKASIDPTQTDLLADLRRARESGAEAVVLWSNSVGLVSRLLNARAAVSWDVSVVGHPTLSSGAIGPQLAKLANWENVFALGFRSSSHHGAGRTLPPRSQEFLQRFRDRVPLNDTLLWWVTCGFDAVSLIAEAAGNAGSAPSEIIGYWNTLKKRPGYFGEYSFSPNDHDGYNVKDVVMSVANSGRDGTFDLAPGYG